MAAGKLELLWRKATLRPADDAEIRRVNAVQRRSQRLAAVALPEQQVPLPQPGTKRSKGLRRRQLWDNSSPRLLGGLAQDALPARLLGSADLAWQRAGR